MGGLAHLCKSNFYIYIRTRHFSIQELAKSKNKYYGRDIFCTFIVLKYIFLGPGYTLRMKELASHIYPEVSCVKRTANFIQIFAGLFVQNLRLFLSEPIKFVKKKKVKELSPTF